MSPYKYSTLAVHAGQHPDPLTGAVNVPVYLSSTFELTGIGSDRGYDYSRAGNPTRDRLETALAALEGGTRATRSPPGWRPSRRWWRCCAPATTSCARASIRQRSGLRRQCSAAKEILLCDPKRQSVEISILGGGSSIIGGTLKTEITREEALELTLEGFLPLTPRGELPKEEKRSLFRELGLPYVSDPAISRHLSAFLESANQVPDAILFNGGFFIPEICRTRVADILENWYGKRPEIFENRDLDLAVASGAAYYSYVRSTGSGVLVRGGLPRAYYIGLNDRFIRGVPCTPRRGRRRQRGSRPRGSAARRQQTSRIPADQLSHPDRRQAWRSGSVRGRRRTASARAARSRDPLRQRRRAAGSDQTGRAFDRNRHARNLVRFEGQREPLALAVPASQARQKHRSRSSRHRSKQRSRGCRLRARKIGLHLRPQSLPKSFPRASKPPWVSDAIPGLWMSPAVSRMSSSSKSKIANEAPRMKSAG